MMPATKGIAWIVIALCLAVAASPVSLICVSSGALRLPCSTGAGVSSTMGSCEGSGDSAQAAPSPAHRSCPMPNSCTAIGDQRETFRGPRGTEEDRLSGQRRIYRKNLLEHPGRAAIYNAIVSNPGIDLAAISQMVVMNRQTLRYHLDLLESLHKITVMRERGTTRYFENSGRYGAIEQRVLLHLRSPMACAILALIRSNPGITQSVIAAQVACSAPTVRWHIHRLLDDGIVTAEHVGRNTRYHLTDEGRVTMQQVAVTPCTAA